MLFKSLNVFTVVTFYIRYKKFGMNTSVLVSIILKFNLFPFNFIIANFNFFLDANCPINIDSKSYEITKKNMETNPNNRWIFDEAAGHVYQLMKNDSYPRYLRSDMYKEYLNGTKKKVFELN